MKTFRSLIVIALLAALRSGSAMAQIPVLGTDEILEKLRLNREVEGNYNILYKDVQGNPYIFKDFHEAILYVHPDKKFTVNIRYDIYADQMHLKDKDMIYAIVHPDKVKLIEAGSYKFIYSAYLKSPEDKDPELSAYFILQSDGKCKLLVKKHVRVQDAETNKLYQDAKPPKFIATGDTYFLKLESGDAIRIKSKKDLLTVLADKSEAISKYISSNKLDIKEVADIEKVVTYYNTL